MNLPRPAARRTAAILTGLSGALAVSALSGCSAGPDPLTAPCAVIVDGSNSGKNFDAARRLAALLPTFLREKGCKRLTYVPMDGSSQGSVCGTKDLDLDPDLGDAVDQESLRASRRAKALKDAHAVLQCSRTDPRSVAGSDVLGALVRAVAQRPADGAYNVLVISDLMQVDGSLNLSRADLSTRESRAALIRNLAMQGRIANLKGVSLEISDRGRTLTDGRRSTQVSQFWDELFASPAAGGPQVELD